MLKNALLQQFTACYDENGWFVAVRNAIEGLSAEEALWKPDGANNSIWESLAHLTFYNFAYLERFKGADCSNPTDDNDETFAAGSGEDEWRATVEKFDDVMRKWRSLLADADDSKFLQPVSATREDPWWSVISHINTHNAYHGGQILLLRKLQGKWNLKMGVS